MAGLFATDGVGLVPLALAIVLALGALWEPSDRVSDGSVRNPPTRPDGPPLASKR